MKIDNPFVRFGILIAEIVILVFLLLPQSLFNSFGCELQNVRQNYQASNGFFIDNQVIVIGAVADVQAVVDPLELTQIEGCDLSYLNTRKSPDSNVIVEEREIVMRLYDIPGSNNLSVEDVIDEINAAREEEPDRYIFADPNYLTRLSDTARDPCSLPNSGGGSGGGRLYGGPGAPDPKSYDPGAAKNAFMNQWAFGSQGINFNLPASSGFDGQEVRVGVFDTSPYRTSLPFFSRIAIAFPSPLWLTTRDAAGTSITSNHGLFVAGLIHRVAPKSRIQLIRVLNDDGCGELWVLNKALEDYKSRASAWSGDLDETVINMSLGIRAPDQAQKEDIDTLEELITEADQMGAIIIAAAGNDSPFEDQTGRIFDPMPAQIPAAYPNVIGVAATNKDGNRSCYSNVGDVAAPGGDGGRAEVPQPNGPPIMDPCAPRASDWDRGLDPCPANDIANCGYGLMSLGLTRYGPQYMYWAGTSFAAPLVSGMAALAYEEMEKEQVICLIQGGPPPATPDPELGTGIINIGNLTNSTVLQLCP